MDREKTEAASRRVRVEKLKVRPGHKVPSLTVPSAGRLSASSFRRGGAVADTSWRRK
jgi:hypothetical protein